MKPELNNDQEMSLIGHLSELRIRLFKCLIALFVCFLIAFMFAEPVLHFLIGPVLNLPVRSKQQELVIQVEADGTLRIPNMAALTPENMATRHFRLQFAPELPQHGQEYVFGEEPSGRIYYHNPLDPFMMQMKVALLVAVLLAMPVLLYQLWKFVNPGLTPKEKRLVRPLMAGAVVLFPIGALFAFYIVQLILLVMQRYRIEGIDPLLSFYPYLSLLTTMMLVFGVIFELPLVVAIAARIGLVTPAQLSHLRRHAYVAMAVAAMILTPSDGFTMLATLVPLVVLYEISILLARPMMLMHRQDAGTTAYDEFEE